MNILLITSQYPGYINQSKIESTYVVHYFAKEWVKDNNVTVVRLWPYYPKILSIFKKVKKSNKYSYEEEFFIDNVRVKRVPVFKIPRINYRNKRIKKISQKIKKYFCYGFIPDIIICDIINPSIYIANIIAKGNRSSLIASLHNTDIKYLTKEKNMEKFMVIEKKIKKIIFRSNQVEKKYYELYKGDRGKEGYSKIFFGIDKKDILNLNEINNKLIDSEKCLLIASNLKKLKNIDILINAFSRIEDKKGYVLKIIGEGVEREALEKLVDYLDCRNCIYFEGEMKREEVLLEMEKADIFVMVSSPETFGLVYIEAMGKGCITIGSKGEGIDGIIIDNENGFLCEPNDVILLKKKLEKIINLSDSKKKRIVKNAILKSSEFCNEALAKEYLNSII